MLLFFFLHNFLARKLWKIWSIIDRERVARTRFRGLENAVTPKIAEILENFKLEPMLKFDFRGGLQFYVFMNFLLNST